MNNQTTNFESILNDTISELIDEKFSSIEAVIKNLSNSSKTYPEYMSKGLACEYIGISRNTLTKFTNEYGLPVRQLGGIKRIAKSDIDSLMLSH